MLVYYFVPFIVSNLYLLFRDSNGHNSETVQNRTHVYMNFFDHKDLGNHLLQLCPKVVKHPVYCMGRSKFFNVNGGGTYGSHCSIKVKRTYLYQNNEHSCEAVRSPEVAVCIFIVTTTFLNSCDLGFMEKR